MLTNAQGLPIAVELASANRNDLYACRRVVRHVGKNQELVADRAYDANAFRVYLTGLGIVPNIARRSFSRHWAPGTIPGHPAPNPLTYAGRWQVERTFAWLLNACRRLKTRYEYYADRYEAFWQLACIRCLLKKLLK